MIETSLLEQLVAFAHEGTLSAAARALHITQPALSRSMKRLEAEFGVPLFTRSSGHIALNETGVIAVRFAERALEANRDMIERTRAFDLSRRTVTFGTCATLPAYALMPVLQEHRTGMGIVMDVASDQNLLDGLDSERYDFVILNQKPDGERFFAQPLMSERLAVLVPATHRLSARGALRFADLAGETILAHGGSGFWLDLVRRELPDTRIIVQDDMTTLDELVHATPLLVFSSDHAMLQHRMPAGSRTVPIVDAAACVTYMLACLDANRAQWQRVFFGSLATGALTLLVTNQEGTSRRVARTDHVHALKGRGHASHALAIATEPVKLGNVEQVFLSAARLLCGATGLKRCHARHQTAGTRAPLDEILLGNIVRMCLEQCVEPLERGERGAPLTECTARKRKRAEAHGHPIDNRAETVIDAVAVAHQVERVEHLDAVSPPGKPGAHRGHISRPHREIDIPVKSPGISPGYHPGTKAAHQKHAAGKRWLTQDPQRHGFCLGTGNAARRISTELARSIVVHGTTGVT